MNKILKYKTFLILLVFFLGAVLRFWGLGSVPPSLYWDEVSQAFNAYSILETGRDEHGEAFPLARFQAFGDYKAPVYIYLDVISLLIFGKNEFSVRLPSALLGSLTVLLTYFLARELVYGSKKRETISLFSSFFLAISPWHIQLSRAAYEGNIATFFTVAGLLLFFLAKRINAYIYIGSAFCLVMAFYSFNAHRVFIPLIVLLLAILYFKEILKNKKSIIIAIFTGLVLLIPYLMFFRTPESKLRFQEVNIFTELQVIEESNRLQEADDNSALSRFLHNRRILYAQEYIENYFDFLNPSYLFFRGDVNPRFSTQENGQLYLFMLPLIITGFYALFKSREKNYFFLIGWFLLAPIAAATARETPHALRSETFIPTYEIIASLGAVFLLGLIVRLKRIKITATIFLAGIILYSLIDFLHTYFVIFPNKYSQDWQYGYREAVEKTETLKDEYDKIVFTNAYGRPYIYVLWYGDYTPQEYWSEGDVRVDPFGFYTTPAFGKYIFMDPVEYTEGSNERVLYVSPATRLPVGARQIDTVRFRNGSSAFEIGDNL